MHLRFPLFASACLVLCTSSPSAATPKFHPFTYPYETLGEGELEVEQYADLIPLRAQNAGSGALQWYGATQFQTEFEYGISSRLELGLYVAYVPTPSSALVNTAATTEASGVKQRLRYRLAESGEWPLDISLYGEVVENEREIELEAKIILQKQLGSLRPVVNLWAEREFYYDGTREWVLQPTAGLSYEISPSVHPGVEGWLRVEWPDRAVHPRPFNLGPVAYVGPTLCANFGRLFWTSGVYVRLNEMDREMAPGDAFGHVWVRSIIGASL